jgi:hypothetical protein
LIRDRDVALAHKVAQRRLRYNASISVTVQGQTSTKVRNRSHRVAVASQTCAFSKWLCPNLVRYVLYSPVPHQHRHAKDLQTLKTSAQSCTIHVVWKTLQVPPLLLLLLLLLLFGAHLWRCVCHTDIQVMVETTYSLRSSCQLMPQQLQPCGLHIWSNEQQTQRGVLSLKPSAGARIPNPGDASVLLPCVSATARAHYGVFQLQHSAQAEAAAAAHSTATCMLCI